MPLGGEERRVGRGENRSGVAADSKEGHVAEVEETGQADNDVQPKGQQQEQADVGQQLVDNAPQDHWQTYTGHADRPEQDNGVPLPIFRRCVPETSHRGLDPAPGGHGQGGKD